MSRLDRKRAERGRRRKRFAGRFAAGLLVVVVVAAVLLGVKLWHAMSGPGDDYTGDGKRDVVIQIQAGDSTTAVGETLHDQGVVATVRTFVDAAHGNNAISSIQPGYYRVRTEIPAASRYRYTGDRFSYMEAGQSKLSPVLLLHGIGANSLHWRYQLAGLASRFRLIAWNAPGYMLSDNLRAETPSGRDYSDALDDFLKALGVAGFNIVANSFGTRIAQSFAYHYPGRIDRAIFTPGYAFAASSPLRWTITASSSPGVAATTAV